MGLMKLKTRLAVAFLTITIVPMMLFYLMAMVLGNYQAKSFLLRQFHADIQPADKAFPGRYPQDTG